MFENVLKITAKRQADAGKEPPVKQQHEVLTKLGYDGTWFKLNSSSFGLGQSRPRVYMVYFHGGCIVGIKYTDGR